MKFGKVLFLMVLGFQAVNALAADCVVNTTRTACPGREKDSYAKCPNGTQSCSSTVDSADAKACESAAIEACLNTRFDVTKYKKVTAKFNNVDFARGQDFCNRDAAYSKGKYIVRDNFPFRDKTDCK
ncbi:MAG: hypothetical protein ACXWQO_08580 [Bdellovibrionota bacterium]